MSNSAIELRHVGVHLPGAPDPILRDVNLSIAAGDLALVIGRTGSGKSTLLSAMSGRVPHFTGGLLTGSVVMAGRDTATHRPRDLADVVGVVAQDPYSGFVTDTVEEELAYAMEQLGLPPGTMRKRVEETLDLLGIADLRATPLAELSGGQAQRVAIGAVLTAHPSILLLDEPTSALDPTGAEEVLSAVSRLVHDLGVTVVLAEHRLERVLHHADQVISLDEGSRVRMGKPADLMRTGEIAPPIVRLGRLAGWSPLPLSVRDARRRAAELSTRLAPHAPSTRADERGDLSLIARHLRVQYRSADVPAVDDVSLELSAGTVTALMGRNGSGKSSLLWALQGSGPRSSGTVAVVGAGGERRDPAALNVKERRALVALVPQNASDLLYRDTVSAECAQADDEAEAAPGTCAAILATLAPTTRGDQHPRDLSEGQRLALVIAVMLSARPSVLLLDEPTRGLDYPAKARLGEALHELAAQGNTIVVATHDVEFAAETADRILVMAGGEIVAEGASADVVVASPAFAPQVAKVLAPQAWLTVEQVERALAEPA